MLLRASLPFLVYAPTHDVAPRAVTIAVAIDAMICTMNLIVSFLLIILMFNVSLGFLALQATIGRAAAWLRQECLMFNV